MLDVSSLKMNSEALKYILCGVSWASNFIASNSPYEFLSLVFKLVWKKKTSWTSQNKWTLSKHGFQLNHYRKEVNGILWENSFILIWSVNILDFCIKSMLNPLNVFQVDWQLTLKKGSAYNENKLFFQTISSSDTDVVPFTINCYIGIWGTRPPVAHEHHLAIQISLPTELFPRKTNRLRHTFCTLMCHCMLPAAVAALLNQSCLLLLLQGTRDPLFLTGVTFPSEYPIYEETKIKLTVYDVKDKSHDTVSTYTASSFGKRSVLFQITGFWIKLGIFQSGYLCCAYARLMFIVSWCFPHSSSLGLVPNRQLVRSKSFQDRLFSFLGRLAWSLG